MIYRSPLDPLHQDLSFDFDYMIYCHLHLISSSSRFLITPLTRIILRFFLTATILDASWISTFSHIWDFQLPTNTAREPGKPVPLVFGISLRDRFFFV